MNDRGLIHIYCGDGKGKTTSAVGLSIRAAGSGMKVLVVQFLKSHKTGELSILEKIPEITFMRGKEGMAFTFSMTDEEKTKTRLMHSENLKNAMDIAIGGECDMLILDEVIGACAHDLIDKAMLETFIRNKPQKLELVLTGRNPEQWMIDCADYVSEIKKVKHPFDQGIKARKGIEK